MVLVDSTNVPLLFLAGSYNFDLIFFLMGSSISPRQAAIDRLPSTGSGSSGRTGSTLISYSPTLPAPTLKKGTKKMPHFRKALFGILFNYYAVAVASNGFT